VGLRQGGRHRRIPLPADNKRTPWADRSRLVTVGVFINPGDEPMKPGEPPRRRLDGRPGSAGNRSVEYDTVSDACAKVLLDEIPPAVRK
jgi:hypothetical protein